MCYDINHRHPPKISINIFYIIFLLKIKISLSSKLKKYKLFKNHINRIKYISIYMQKSLESYRCKQCNKDYAGYQSLWNHNKKFHNTHPQISSISPQKLLISPQNSSNNCEFCNKSFSRNDNLKRHLQTCKKRTTEITELQNQIKTIKQELDTLKNKQTKITNNNNGTINNNNIFICPPGEEKIALTNEEMNDILKEKMTPITKLVKYTNFDKNRPENHSFCTNNLNGPHLLTYDNETKQIVVSRKKHFYDKLISNEIKQFEIILHTKKLSSKQKDNIKYTIERLKELQELPNDKIFKSLLKEFNMISYNYKNIVKKTWKNMGLFDKENKPEDIMEDDIFIKDNSDSDIDIEV